MSMLGVFQLRLIWKDRHRDDDEDSGYVPTPEHERDEAMPQI